MYVVEPHGSSAVLLGSHGIDEVQLIRDYMTVLNPSN